MDETQLKASRQGMTIQDMSPVSSDSEYVGQICRPWRRAKRQCFNSETILVLARHNYKVYANLGFIRWATTRYAVILDTGAGSIFIWKDVIPQRQWSRIKHTGSYLRSRDAGNHRVDIIATIDLSIEVGSQVAIIKLYVVGKLVTDVILDCEFCDKHVEDIISHQRVVEIEDGTTVPIIRHDVTRSRTKVPTTEAQIY